MVLHQTSGAYVGRGYESGISHHDPGALQIIVCYCKSQGREEYLHLRQKKQQQHKIKKKKVKHNQTKIYYQYKFSKKPIICKKKKRKN